MDHKFSKKHLALTLIVIGLAGVLLFIFLKTEKQNEATQAQPTFQNPSQAAQTEAVSPREIQIQNYLNFPDKFPTSTIDGQIFSLVTYPSSNLLDKVQNFNEKPVNKSGVIVFNGKADIWESGEDLQEVEPDQTEFKDVTGDGVPEIVVTDEGGGNEPSCALDIYKWNGTSFQLITPEGGIGSCKGGLQEIGSSSVYEVTQFTWELDSPNADPLGPNYKEVEQIYRFDGSQYSLWKETPTGAVGNPVF